MGIFGNIASFFLSYFQPSYYYRHQVSGRIHPRKIKGNKPLTKREETCVFAFLITWTAFVAERNITTQQKYNKKR